MDEVTGQADPYVRVYYRITEDEKFSVVYDNDSALATWLRLLITADAMYPAAAPIPLQTDMEMFEMLVGEGLVERVASSRYRIHGLAAERERRSEVGRSNVAKRWTRGVADDYTALAKLAEDLTGRPYAISDQHSKLGERVRDLLDRHGLEKVESAFRRVAEAVGRPTPGQLVLGASNALDPVPMIRPEPEKPKPAPMRCPTCKGSQTVPLDIGPDGKWEAQPANYPTGLKPCPDCVTSGTATQRGTR